MKKFLLVSAAALMMGAAALTGCSDKGDKAASGNTALGDSLATAFGSLQGAQFVQYLNSLDSLQRKDISKEAFLKGLEKSLFADTTNQGYTMGLNTGMGFLGEIVQIERSSNIRIDRRKLFDAFKKAIESDSVDMSALQMQMQQVAGRVREEMQAFREEQQMNAPEVQENIKAGEAYVAKMKQTDPSIKTTASGLSYKVTAEGEGEVIQLDNKVKLRYTGRKVDGSTFDESPAEGTEFYPAQVVPGFREALQMMKKGSKYTVYIPGKLAYGVNGQPMAGIGPMETLVFDIEVLDITNPEPVAVEAPQGAQPAQAQPVQLKK